MLRIIEIDGAQAQVLAWYCGKEKILLQFIDAMPPEEKRFYPTSKFAIYPVEEVEKAAGITITR